MEYNSVHSDEVSKVTGPELRDNIQLLPMEPPPFLSLMAERTEVPDLTGYIPRGIDWVLMKYEIPLSILTEIQREAYPDSKFDISSTERGLEKSLYMHNLDRAGFKKSRILLDERKRAQFINQLIKNFQERPELLRIADWTAALMIAYDIVKITGKIPDFEVTAFGFDIDENVDNQLVFGVFSYTEQKKAASEELRSLKIGDYEFPSKVRYGEWVDQSNSHCVHPEGGTATCWAISKSKTGVERVGLLTAAHILKPCSKGKSIQTSCGIGKVLEVAPGGGEKWGIDAMLVSSPCSPSALTLRTNHKPIKAKESFADHTQGYFLGKNSGYVETFISQATDMFGTLDLNFSGRLVLTKYGQPGDSGALIMTDNNEGAGLYSKIFCGKDGITRGLAMFLAQIKDCMGLELYELRQGGG